MTFESHSSSARRPCACSKKPVAHLAGIIIAATEMDNVKLWEWPRQRSRCRMATWRVPVTLLVVLRLLSESYSHIQRIWLSGKRQQRIWLRKSGPFGKSGPSAGSVQTWARIQVQDSGSSAWGSGTLSKNGSLSMSIVWQSLSCTSSCSLSSLSNSFQGFPVQLHKMHIFY